MRLVPRPRAARGARRLYARQVRAKNLAGWGPFSPPVSAATPGMLVAWGLASAARLSLSHAPAAPAASGPAVGFSDLPLLRGAAVRCAAAGGAHSVAVCDGRAFTWGSNSHGQLGRAAAGDHDGRPAAVEIRGERAAQTGAAAAATYDGLQRCGAIRLLRQVCSRAAAGSRAAADMVTCCGRYDHVTSRGARPALGRYSAAGR